MTALAWVGIIVVLVIIYMYVFAEPQFTTYDNTSYVGDSAKNASGNYISLGKATDAGKCQSLCAGAPWCNGYTFINKDQSCTGVKNPAKGNKLIGGGYSSGLRNQGYAAKLGHLLGSSSAGKTESLNVPQTGLELFDVQAPRTLVEPFDVQAPHTLAEPFDVQAPRTLVEPFDVQAPRTLVEPFDVAVPKTGMQLFTVIPPRPAEPFDVAVPKTGMQLFTVIPPRGAEPFDVQAPRTLAEPFYVIPPRTESLTSADPYMGTNAQEPMSGADPYLGTNASGYGDM